MKGELMKKNFKFIILALILFVPIFCLAAPGDQGSSSSASYKGATTISSSTTLDSKTYSSTTGGENSLLVSGGSSTLTSCTINKTGDSSDENADFYGTNAGILVYNGATLNISNSSVTTSAGHANAVFAYGSGIINISDTSIKTSGNNSGGVMVTGGGSLTATNLTVSTSGNSSASIRSDRGGGTLTVNKGTYSTSGVGSPTIYSTANITVNEASLTSTSSEGAVIEGANSITLNKTTLTDTNTSLNGNSETYKNIFIYQSMSGDASSGEGTFSATDSTITTNKGDTIFATNTTGTINLTNNTITNTSGDFLRIQTGKWGNSGSNGGNITLNMSNQKVVGNIIVDNISTLAMSLKDGSVYQGAIDNSNQAKKITLSLSSDSVWVLDGDSYLDSLTNETSDNSNIYLNGHSLYVNGSKVSANTGTYSGTVKTNKTATNSVTSNATTSNNIMLYIVGGIVAIAVIVIVVIVIILKKRNKKRVLNNTL
jgi:hypothetical protein